MSTKSVEYIKTKYGKDEIYIFVGKVLLAINPNKNIDGLYSSSAIKRYYHEENLPPHVLSIAKEAKKNVLNKPQSIIITGETGAGKSESTKNIIRFLCEPAREDLMNAITNAGPILNAFGNSLTEKNKNSSRYTKFFEIHYDSKLDVIGANIRQFMLEKSRILDYHIFCSLVNAPTDIKTFLKLNDPLFENIVHNAEEWTSLEEVDKSLNYLFPQTKKFEIYQFIAGIFCLSKISFQSDANEYSIVSEEHPLKLAAQLLSFDRSELTSAPTTRTMQVLGENGEKIIVHLTVTQAQRARDALIKTIYTNFFEWLVQQINKKINPIYLNNTEQYYIGILDMPGFECFPINSFEQLIINYANESIHQFCLKNVVKENSVDVLNISNHQNVINLIGNPEVGILTLLDDEGKLKADTNFAQVIYERWSSSPVLIRKNPSPITSFIIRHYVSDVTYQTENFIEKNSEAVSETILKLGEICLRNVTNSVVSLAKTSKIFVSEGLKLKHDLEALLKTLDKNGSNFIRCIKANDLQRMDCFDAPFVHHQLLTTGTDVLIKNEASLWQLGEDTAGEAAASESVTNDVGKEVVQKSIPKPATKSAAQTTENDSRFDQIGHWVDFDSFQSGSRCKNKRQGKKCNMTIHTYCSKCEVYLCSLRDRNCFKTYHHRN